MRVFESLECLVVEGGSLGVGEGRDLGLINASVSCWLEPQVQRRVGMNEEYLSRQSARRALA